MNSSDPVEQILSRAVEILINKTFEYVKEHSGSPIETKFFEAFALEAMESQRLLVGTGINYNVDPPENWESKDPESFYRGVYSSYRDICIYVYPQEDVDGHRVDFCFAFTPSKRLAFVECDGYEWHSSKEQFSKDRAFDRAIIKLFDGRAPVFRFSGSQINRDPKGCATEVLQYLVGGEGFWDVEKDS